VKKINKPTAFPQRPAGQPPLPAAGGRGGAPLLSALSMFMGIPPPGGGGEKETGRLVSPSRG